MIIVYGLPVHAGLGRSFVRMHATADQVLPFDVASGAIAGFGSTDSHITTRT